MTWEWIKIIDRLHFASECNVRSYRSLVANRAVNSRCLCHQDSEIHIRPPAWPGVMYKHVQSFLANKTGDMHHEHERLNITISLGWTSYWNHHLAMTFETQRDTIRTTHLGPMGSQHWELHITACPLKKQSTGIHILCISSISILQRSTLVVLCSIHNHLGKNASACFNDKK